MTEAQLADWKVSQLHQTLQKRVCQQLRTSGVANFAHVQHCAVDVLENPGSLTTRLSEQNAYEAMNGLVTDVELSMLGLSQDLTLTDLAFLQDAVVQAHNDAFADTGYQIKNFATVSFMDTGTYRCDISRASRISSSRLV